MASRWINYPFLSRIDPWLETIRSDPRFETLMARVKREWEAFEAQGRHGAIISRPLLAFFTQDHHSRRTPREGSWSIGRFPTIGSSIASAPAPWARYLAEDVRLGRKVALKLLPPHLTREEAAKTRLIHEARAASLL